MTDAEALVVLGLPAGATTADIRAARRRLARLLHPDVSPGDGVRMRDVNAAAAHLLGRAPAAPVPAAPPDEASFSVNALPAYAFEVLRVTVAALGEVLDTDEPYHLDGWLADPGCLIALQLVPDAGGSTITLTVDPDEGVPADQAAAALIAQL